MRQVGKIKVKAAEAVRPQAPKLPGRLKANFRTSNRPQLIIANIGEPRNAEHQAAIGTDRVCSAAGILS